MVWARQLAVRLHNIVLVVTQPVLQVHMGTACLECHVPFRYCIVLLVECLQSPDNALHKKVASMLIPVIFMVYMVLLLVLA